jgi:uncharacterized protein
LGCAEKPQQYRKARNCLRGRQADFRGATVERVDDRFDYGEVRVYAVGLVNGLEITVVYTDKDDDERRIISAWRAEPNERRYFWQNVEG